MRGAIRELEKTYPCTGFAFIFVISPTMLRADRERYRDDREVSIVISLVGDRYGGVNRRNLWRE